MTRTFLHKMATPDNSKQQDETKSAFLQKVEAELAKQKEMNTEPAGPPPVKPEQPKKKKKGISALALFATTFLLFFFLVIFLIFVLSVGGAENPVLRFFGQREDTIKDFLLSVTSISFGTLSMLLLFVGAIAFFLSFSLKENPKRKKTAFVFGITALVFEFFTALAWIFMWNYVGSLAAAASNPAGLVLTVPSGEEYISPVSEEEMEGVSAPADLEFSAKSIVTLLEERGREVVSLEWDFGTGFQEPSKDSETMHRFFSPGQQEVIVRITLANGDTIEDAITFTIPQGSFLAKPRTGVAPLLVEFDASALAFGIQNIAYYEWDIDGDRQPEETTEKPYYSHRFESKGSYQIRLSVIDEQNNVKHFTQQVEVTESSGDFVLADISTYPEYDQNLGVLEVHVGEKVSFFAEDSYSKFGDIVRYQWRIFGQTKEGQEITYTFDEVGDTRVSLIIEDEEGNTAEESITVRVLGAAAEPNAVIITNPEAKSGKPIIGEAPFVVSFDASGSTDPDNNIIRYDWDFDGDGEADESGESIEYTFRDLGTYEVTLQVTDADQQASTDTVTVLVEKDILVARVIADPETAEAPCQIVFDGSTSSCLQEDCDITAYEWDFGDGTGSQFMGAEAPHFFEQIGRYNVTLIVHTNFNTSAEVEKYVFCRETPIKACFTSSRTSGTAPLSVSFDPSCSEGTINRWEWDFGDDGTSRDQKPVHTFEEPGDYTVKLRLMDDKNNVALDELLIRVK